MKKGQEQIEEEQKLQGGGGGRRRRRPKMRMRILRMVTFLMIKVE